MTGSPAPGVGSGDQTLTDSQSSPGASCDSASMPKCPACGGGGPYETASRTPLQPRTGCGAANRSAPTGGSANGIPRKTATPASRLPRTTPATARTSGRGPDDSDAATVITTSPGWVSGLAASADPANHPPRPDVTPVIYG